MSKMSELDIQNQNVILDQENKILVSLLHAIGDYFCTNPEQGRSCREYLEEMDVFDRDVLDAVFRDISLPCEVTVAVEDLNIDDINDEDDVSDAVVNFLTEAYGYCINGCDWVIDTQDSGEPKQVVINNIDWDIEN